MRKIELQGVWRVFEKKLIEVWNQSDPPRLQKKITKKYNFTNNGFPYIHIRKQVDEAEIFEGDQNTLIMTQTYTEDFQCQYMLQRYPFDTQAKTFYIDFNIISFSGMCY